MILRAVFVIALLYCAIARAGTYVQFRTAWGDIEVELYDADKPVTVRNFIRYVQSGLYTNMFSTAAQPTFFPASPILSCRGVAGS